MAELEEKILQDAAYRPIVFHDQDPHTVVSAAREIPAVVDAQGRTNRHDFQGLSISSVALPGWKSGQFLSDGQKVGGHPVTAGAARAPGWHRIESVPHASLSVDSWPLLPRHRLLRSARPAGVAAGEVTHVPSSAAKGVSSCGSGRPAVTMWRTAVPRAGRARAIGDRGPRPGTVPAHMIRSEERRGGKE